MQLNSSLGDLVHYFVAQIKKIPQIPTTCVSCGKSELKKDAVLATMGPSEKNADYVPSILCLACETLMIITANPEATLGIHHSVGNQVTVRE